MIDQYSKYGAVVTKVRAMYAKRLTDSDWENLNNMRSLAGVVNYLKKHPGWEAHLADVPAVITRGEMEATLSGAIDSDFMKLYRYASDNDRRHLLFTVYQVEYRTILARLRKLYSGNFPTTDRNRVPDSIKSISKLDFQALIAADNWGEVLSAVKDTLYYQPLRSIGLIFGSNLPDYTAVSVLLQGKYYEAMTKFIKAHYKGKIKSLFLSSVGQDIDLQNLIHIMRMKRYFNNSPQEPQTMLFPVFYKLPRDFFDQIISAPSYDSALEMMNNTYYGKFFSSHSYDTIDEYYKQRVYEFNIKQMRAAPSPYIFTAYIALKRYEIKRLNSCIEKAFYAGTDLLKKA